MPRRVTLPTADDLFRPTVVPDPVEDIPLAREPASAPAPTPTPAPKPAPTAVREPAHRAPDPTPPPAPRSTGSGRVKHDEKMTVYVTPDELLDIEHARLLLRRDHGLGVDRGRLVRAAVAIALADLDAHGEESVIVRRLSGPEGREA